MDMSLLGSKIASPPSAFAALGKLVDKNHLFESSQFSIILVWLSYFIHIFNKVVMTPTNTKINGTITYQSCRDLCFLWCDNEPHPVQGYQYNREGGEKYKSWLRSTCQLAQQALKFWILDNLVIGKPFTINHIWKWDGWG